MSTTLNKFEVGKNVKLTNYKSKNGELLITLDNRKSAKQLTTLDIDTPLGGITLTGHEINALRKVLIS